MEPRPVHRRINRITLAGFEQRALPWMARRLPERVTPDMLTSLGIFAAFVIFAAYLLSDEGLGWLWLASLGFVVHWWADSLDGTLARIRHIERPRYGFYVDHQADAVTAILVFAGLGISQLMDLAVALLCLSGYLLLMLHVSLVTVTRGVFKISFGRVGPTEARLFMIVVNAVVFATGNPEMVVFGVETTIFTAVGAVGGAILYVIYLVSSMQERRLLARLDPPPPRSHATAGPEGPSPGRAPTGT